MKKLLYILLFSVAGSMVAQEKINTDGIALATYVPQQIENVPASARKMLVNRLAQIITKNGISENPYNSRFVLYLMLQF